MHSHACAHDNVGRQRREPPSDGKGLTTPFFAAPSLALRSSLMLHTAFMSAVMAT
jgi:hypothetical protein